MAYDSKTYGQSPFGNTKPSNGQNPTDLASKPGASSSPAAQGSQSAQPKPAEKPAEKSPAKLSPPADDGLDKGPRQLQEKSDRNGLASRFPSLSDIKAKLNGPTPLTDTSANSTEPVTGKTSSKTTDKPSRSARKSAAKKSTRKSGKSKAAQAEAEAAEQAIERRFLEEDRNAYLSLLYKTGISGLLWAVLRLVRYELSAEAITIINLIIHPFAIAALAFACTLGLTFWTRRLLNDLARHTQQLHLDAEAPDSKTFRPTLEIVGDSLEYNPGLRKNFARLFNAASIVICSLVSYLITFALFPTR